ncbi:hypothetical protein CYLTODRAFT_460565 [Cylindrobasidium torrendii FP15055 ss-10]|uniref:Uncharacterized protein n=1 Tax=Cylindrobasidium torrendii FP15055 ss-10 TaxID=1314674 RepID=A0A0D7AS49_9AGAR|nr:hypothetical protein CYLTODRAFT_460565 [Cylindrobasidium torrendii FP15055 ss-10]
MSVFRFFSWRHTNLALSGQVSPVHNALILVMVQLIPLLVKGFPGSFNSNKDFTMFWQIAMFYKKQRKAEAEAKKAKADTCKALLNKKARDIAQKDADICKVPHARSLLKVL